ncbi:hypothetical protein ACJJTC_000944, partial [Scirpophaga incertulas]
MNSYGAQNGGQVPCAGQPAASNDPRLQNVVQHPVNSQIEVKSFASIENASTLRPVNNVDMPSIYVSQPPPPQMSLPSILIPPPPPPRTAASLFSNATPIYFRDQTPPSTSGLSFAQQQPQSSSIMSASSYRQPSLQLPENFDASIPPPSVRSLAKRPISELEVTSAHKMRRSDNPQLARFPCEKCLQRKLREEQNQKELESLSKQMEYKTILLRTKQEETNSMRSILNCLLPTSVCTAVERNLHVDVTSIEDLFARSLINSTERSPSPECRSISPLLNAIQPTN